MAFEGIKRRLFGRKEEASRRPMQPPSKEAPIIKDKIAQNSANEGIIIERKEPNVKNDIIRAQYLSSLRKFKEALEKMHHKDMESYLDRNLKEEGVHELHITVSPEFLEKLEGIGIKFHEKDTPVLTISKPPHIEAPIVTFLESAERIEGHKRFIANTKVSAVIGRKDSYPYAIIREGFKRTETHSARERTIPDSISRVHANVEVMQLPDGKTKIIVRHVGNKEHPIYVEIAKPNGEKRVIMLGSW
jgi:hypothetical protein